MQVFDGTVPHEYIIHLTIGDCVSQWDPTVRHWNQKFHLKLHGGRPVVVYPDGRMELIKDSK